MNTYSTSSKTFLNPRLMSPQRIALSGRVGVIDRAGANDGSQVSSGSVGRLIDRDGAIVMGDIDGVSVKGYKIILLYNSQIHLHVL